MGDKCTRGGQALNVTDGSTGQPVRSASTRRACRGCGVVVTVITNADGLALMPAHNPAGPPQQ